MGPPWRPCRPPRPARTGCRSRRGRASCPGPGCRPPRQDAPDHGGGHHHRQRRDRSRPSGNSRNGRVMPRAIAGAQMNSLATTASWAASGSGGWSRSSWSSQGSQGMSATRPGPRRRTASRSGWPAAAGSAPAQWWRSRAGRPAHGRPPGEHREGERPGHGQRDQQAGGAAAEGGQPHRPGQHGRGPCLHPHHGVLAAVSIWVPCDPGWSAVRQRYGPPEP